jgi:sigma-B regulation protein RsbU (phosphoserine phosphatase)
MAARDPLPQIPLPQSSLYTALRRQLEHRREILSGAADMASAAKIMQLLHDVDAALERMESGRYGVCELCHEEVEEDRLMADPLVRVCLCELNASERGALEKDLELASRIQQRLLPRREFACDGWQVAYHYKPVSVVSGDYCDLMVGPDEQLYFMLGDVAGKGVAASILMSNLSAIFRASIPQGLPIAELVEHVNRIFTASTLLEQYATLVCGRASSDGTLEVCNAGHVPGLVISGSEVRTVPSSGFPVGLFADQKVSTCTFQFAPGSSLVLFSDGVSEARNGDDDYGYERIACAVLASSGLHPCEVVANCVRDLERFVGSEPVFDDQTLMVLQKIH